MASTQQIAYITGDDGIKVMGYADPSNLKQAGQTFTPTVDFSLDLFKFKLHRLGSPGAVSCYVYDTAAGIPSPLTLITSGTYADGNGLTSSSSGQWIDISVTPTDLTNGTMYAVALFCVSGDSSNHARSAVDTSSPTYAGGTSIFTDTGGANWAVDATKDHMFEVWGETSGVYDEGELAVSAAASVVIVGESQTYNEGELAVSAAASVAIVDESYLDASTYPEGRPTDYDPDLTWDETSATWSATFVSVVQNRTLYFVAIGEHGEVYFDEAI